ncbi:hypothetical protein CIT292_09132 [Citrobacter youngae ATCC 29220]|uniref:Uncharacterized protein n=1 Tax=Citrobacter youngae ATCC 29220 TaxID=500640 RepID=D4BFW3_9ENTR|nr:hypothetical protein CIT292_09132 [Citrobacter youngae ATCC 29220]
MLFHHYSFNTILKNKEEMAANTIYCSHEFQLISGSIFRSYLMRKRDLFHSRFDI